MAAAKVYYATGKRKTSSARVFLKPGTGKITVNAKKMEDYLTTSNGKAAVQVPMTVTNLTGKLDVDVTVSGGGPTGQSEAIRHGISRALLAYDEKLREPLKAAGLLTRDDRMVERKKYGKHKARRSGQFSKR